MTLYDFIKEAVLICVNPFFCKTIFNRSCFRCALIKQELCWNVISCLPWQPVYVSFLVVPKCVVWFKGRSNANNGSNSYLKRSNKLFSWQQFWSHVCFCWFKPFGNYRTYQKSFLRPPYLAPGQICYLLQKQGDIHTCIYMMKCYGYVYWIPLFVIL